MLPGMGHDEHLTMRHLDQSVSDRNVDGLTGEPATDVILVAGQADPTPRPHLASHPATMRWI